MKLLALVVACALAVVAVGQVNVDGPAISPFRGMRLAGEQIEVQITDDTWYELTAVAGVDSATLLREAKRLCGAQAWKRITEDLPALLDAMGHQVGEQVDLQVRDLATGATKELPKVTMTAENRRRVAQANRRQPAPDLEGPAPVAMSPADARSDLRTLRTLLDTAFAYRDLRAVDVDALLRAADAAIGDQPLARDDFANIVDRVLRAFGDGHTRIDGMRPACRAFLPFLVQEVAGGHAAFSPERDRLLDAERPFVAALDGVPLAKWLAAARRRGTAGSPTMQAREAERGLRHLGLLRQDLQLPERDQIVVTLRGPHGERDLAVAVATRCPSYGTWPKTTTRTLDGNLGYLRLESMRDDAGFLASLDEAMHGFRDTVGLVIDVRGNGGGTRDALRRLAPYLLPADGAPVVGNVAAVLLDGGKAAPTDALADRGLYPLDWTGWSDAQRGAITAFVRSWRPSWKLPAGKFSPWHFLVLDRSDNNEAFAYKGPVAVLIDRGCFSATDVFAAALGALPNVVLVGEGTSGGSGRARRRVLPKSGVVLQLSSMASFRPDGVLFEGNGVEPDHAVAGAPTDLIGSTDRVLEAAVAVLLRKGK